jgi:hypothetical protein
MRKPLVALALFSLLLAACGPATPTPTPEAAPSVSTVAPAPEDTAPAAPAPGPEPRGDSALGTFFFYWYNCPQRECDAGQLSVVPPGWLGPLPYDDDERDGTAYSSFNYDWFERELRDMAEIGIDTVFPVSWGDHPHPWFRQDRLDLLVQANGVLERPLQVGMFLDTTAQQAMYNDFVADGYRFGPGVPQLPLDDPRSGYFFYDRHIKGFFERVPREMWATHDGRPIIITYTALCCRDMQRAGALWGAVKAAFARDFGVEPWLILEDTWFTPEALSVEADRRSVDQAADGRYSWGTALNGPSTRELRGYSVSSVGPGFDNRLITGIVDPRHQPREVAIGGAAPADGAFFKASLAAVPRDTNLVLVETWNEWPESTGIARAAYVGVDGRPLPEDFYMNILRDWREKGAG